MHTLYSSWISVTSDGNWKKLLKIESLIFLLLLYPSFMRHQNLIGPYIGEHGSDKFKERK